MYEEYSDDGDSSTSDDPCNTSSEEFEFAEPFDEAFDVPHTGSESSDEKTTSSDSSTGTTDRGYAFQVKMTPLDERLGIFMSSTPPVIESILRNMTAIELNRCAKVCKMWNKVANTIKSKRNTVLGILQVKIETLYSQGKVDHPDVETEFVGCGFSEMLCNSHITPKLGIIFCSECMVTKPKRYFLSFSKRDMKKKLKRFDEGTLGAEYISYLLPSKSSFVLCTTGGFIGISPETNKGLEFQERIGISSVFFPEIQGIETYTFSIPEFRRTNKKAKTDELDISGVPADKEIKCLLIFLDCFPSNRKKFYQALFGRHIANGQAKTAIGGVLSQAVLHQNNLDKKEQFPTIGAGIAFTGDNVEAASIIIDQHVREEVALEARLREMKAGIVLRKRTVGFLFACCARGSIQYGRDNMEPEYFQKVFPNVPIYGMFGNGEIGIKYLPHGAKEKEPATDKDLSWYHGYTSVFVLITWN